MSIKTKLIVLFLAFAVIPLALLGELSYLRAIHSAKDETLSRLEIMADTATDLVETFFSERRGDILVAQNVLVLKNSLPTLTRLIDDRQNPAFISAYQEVIDQLTNFKRALKYNDVVVVDPDGRVLCAVEKNAAGKRVGDRYPDRDGRMLAAARTGIYLTDVYLDPSQHNNYEIAIAAPVQDPGGALLGMVILEIEMDTVFHAISKTSELGKTGEMVLAERQGDAVRFISPLRHPFGTVLQQVEKFRPAGRAFPAQLAVTGKSGSGAARDYRGEETLAAWRWLPDLEWGLVVKIDTAEVMAPVNRVRDWALAMGLVTVLLGAVLAWVLGRSITSPLLDLERGAEIIGSGNLGHKIDNRSPDEVGKLARAFDAMTGRLKEVTASRDELNAEIARRTRSEREEARIRKALATLSQVNQAMLRADGEEELLPLVCRIIVEFGGYRLSWIGYKVDDPEQSVRPVAQAGFEEGYLENAGITWADNERGRGPTGQAIRTCQTAVCQNFLTDPAFEPWRDQAVARGYASSLALPLFDNGKILGALMVYAADPDAFGEEETALLKELSDDLSFGISFRRNRAAHASTEEALWKKDALLRQVVSNAPVILHSVDRDEIVTLSEGKGLNALNRPAGWSAVGKSLTELYGQNPEVIAANRRALAGKSFHQDLRIGETILSTWFEPIREAGGEISGAIGVSTDVTELRRAEVELRKAHHELELRIDERTRELAQLSRRYRNVTELTTDYVYQLLVRPDGKLAADYFTDRFFEILGYAREDIIDPDQRIKLMVHPEDAHLLEALNLKVLAGRDGAEEIRYYTKDRRIKWIQNYERPLWDDKHEKVIGILGAGQDITERKRVEAAAREAAEEWSRTFDSISDLILIIDRDHRVVRVNRAARAALGGNLDEILGQHCYGIIHRTDCAHLLCPHSSTLSDGREHSQEIFEPSLGLTLQVSTTPMVSAAGELIGSVHVMRDITVKKRAEEELQKSREHLEEMVEARTAEVHQIIEDLREEIDKRELAQRAEKEARKIIEEQRARAIFSDRLRSLGEMAAGMAHELNQPLLGVRGLAEHLVIAIERDWKLSPENVREKAALIVNQADRMSHVIEHSRMFARGADAAELSRVQVNEVIDAALSLIGSQLKARGITTTLDLAPDLPRVMANPFSLEEVVINLISNARDAIEDRYKKQGRAQPLGLTIRSCRRQPEGGKDEVIVTIADQGIGMDQPTMDKAFEPFFTTKEMDRGTGLGLSISRTIVQRFGGTIELNSEPGQGTTVTFVLPV